MSAAARGAQFALVSVGGAVRAADLQTRREPRAVGRALAAWAAPQHAADFAGATLHAVARLCGHRMRVWAGVLGPGLGLLPRGRPWIGEPRVRGLGSGSGCIFAFSLGGSWGAVLGGQRQVSDSPRLPGPPWRRHSRWRGGDSHLLRVSLAPFLLDPPLSTPGGTALGQHFARPHQATGENKTKT